ncbi:hypothetical protein PISMIDRAFT_11504 [Pisolithus microcarpus 441]|uniref:Uncharacterized protein n=1 Tax=Pisolithus microcarpus 441 TaxID=765257 RepID=A0A0C9ZJJ8_9AGAM|nr:hypothetical protein PISMIDRAFT_11504 [Pisolithus microcarpus 441]
MSKRVRMTSVSPPAPSAPPKVTSKVHLQVISQATPAAVATASLPIPQETPVPAVSSLAGNLLFYPSSQSNTPISFKDAPPSPVQGNDDLTGTAVAFGPSISGVLKGEPKTPKELSIVEEIDLTTPQALLICEEGAPPPSKGKDQAETTEMSPFEELDARIEAIEELIEWGEDTLVEMHGQIACLAMDTSEVGSAIQQARWQLQVLRKWRWKKFIEGLR